MKPANLRRAFTWFESGPVIFVTSSDRGKDNVMTISWQAVMDFLPHIVISTGPWNHSFETILETRQCVLCVPGVEQMENAVSIGTISGEDVDKFKMLGLNKEKADCVNAPLIPEMLACLECELEDYIEAHGLLILKGIRLHENPDRIHDPVFHAVGDGTFVIDGERKNLRDGMKTWVPDGCERFFTGKEN